MSEFSPEEKEAILADASLRLAKIKDAITESAPNGTCAVDPNDPPKEVTLEDVIDILIRERRRSIFDAFERDIVGLVRDLAPEIIKTCSYETRNNGHPRSPARHKRKRR